MKMRMMSKATRFTTIPDTEKEDEGALGEIL